MFLEHQFIILMAAEILAALPSQDLKKYFKTENIYFNL